MYTYVSMHIYMYQPTYSFIYLLPIYCTHTHVRFQINYTSFTLLGFFWDSVFFGIPRSALLGIPKVLKSIVRIHTHILYAYIHTYVHKRTHLHTHTCIYAYTYTHTNIYTHVHEYSRTCNLSFGMELQGC